MPRVKRGKIHIKKRKKILKSAKGYKWGRKNLLKLAKVAVLKAKVHSYRERKRKKRVFRRLWQIKINAFVRNYGFSYSSFINALKKNNIKLDRKILADISENNPKIMEKIIENIKS